MSRPSSLIPRQHAYVPQDGTDECATCSMPYTFGGLHPTVYTYVPILTPVLCDSCGHDPHAEPCRWWRYLHVGAQRSEVAVCGCTS